MIFDKSITASELDNFVYNQDYSHYMHASNFAMFKHNEEHCAIHYTALKSGDEIVATAIVLEYKEPLIGSYMYIPCGICMDYSNTALFKEYSDYLLEFAKEQHAFSLFLDPNVIRQEHTLDGEVIEDGVNNEALTQFLIGLGYQHHGYTYGYDGSKRNRYTLLLDIDKEYSELLKAMPKTKQALLKRQSKLAVSVIPRKKEIAGNLALYARQLAQIQKFTPHTKEYFEHLFDVYDGHCYGYEAIIDFKEQITLLEAELASNKYAKDKSARESAELNLAKTKENLLKYGNQASLGVAFYVTCNSTSYNLFNYVNKDLISYHGTDIIHNHVIQEMQERGIKHYDLVGFSGVVDKNDAFYGLYEYKKSFNPNFIEHIGEFCYVFSDSRLKISKIYHEVHRLKNRLIQKLSK